MTLITKVLNIVAAFIITLTGRDTYIEGVVGQPTEFNPLQTTANPVDKNITNLIFSGLTKINANGSVTPDIAKKWEISKDNKTYTVHIKKEAQFHDGTTVTAKDFLHTASQSAQLGNIDINTEKEKEIKINLETPYAPLLRTLTLGIIPKDRINGRNLLTPIGSGPYQIANIERGTKKIDEITLKKVDPNTSGFRKIIFKFFENEEELLTAANLGEVDGFSSQKNCPENFSTNTTVLEGRYYALLFNLKGKELLKDSKLRTTLAHLVNREKIINNAADGHGSPAYAPLETTWAAADIDKPKYSPDDILEFEGTIELVFPDAEKYKIMANIIKEDWEKTGLKINLNPHTAEQIKNSILPNRTFDVVIIGQEVGRDPDQYNLWHSTQAADGHNFSGFENMRADQALEQGRTVHDKEKRKEHYQYFQTVFMEQMPAIFIYRPTYTYNIRRTMGDLNLEGIFNPEERWNRIIKLSNN